MLSGLTGAWKDAAVVAAETTAGGSVGVTASGAVTYRPVDDFAGTETVTLRLRTADGSTGTVSAAVEVAQDPIVGGWASGEHYVLARDAEGWSVAEPGRNHRMVYVSPDGRADADGLTPETAITPAAYEALLVTLFHNPYRIKDGTQPASWHVLFERGHDYGDYAPQVVSGEDPLHPFLVGAWGAGDRPLFGADLKLWKGEQNVVVRDVAFGYSVEAAEARAVAGIEYRVNGIDVLGRGQKNILVENVLFTPHNAAVRVQAEAEAVTFRRSMIVDSARDAPADGAADWTQPSPNKIQGLFVSGVSGLLLEETLFHHNGWQEGYDPAGGPGAQPPSKFSHNVYLTSMTSNVTLRDNIIAEAASTGAQLRGGAVVEGNLLFGNNVGINLSAGAEADDARLGERSRAVDVVVTAPSNKDAINIGAQGWGIVAKGGGLIADTIVAQDGDARLGKGPLYVGNALVDKKTVGGPYVLDGETVFNWGAVPDRLANPGLSTSSLLGVALEGFARAALGAGATVDDLVALWRARDRADWSDAPDADEAIAFFRKGFGYAQSTASTNRTVTFDPDPAAEGFRWDSRLNWSQDMKPIDGDVVRLDGHAVTYGGETLRLAGLDFGRGGELRVAQGLIETLGSWSLAAALPGGAVTVDRAGQFLFAGYGGAAPISIEVDGGRAANRGVVSGTMDVTVRGGQMLLADPGGAFNLASKSRLIIDGDDGAVGFDGAQGAAAFKLTGGALHFVFDADGVTPIAEFASGRFGAADPGVRTTATLQSGKIVIDLSALPTTASGRYVLIDVDVIDVPGDDVIVQFLGTPAGLRATVGIDAATGVLFLDIGGGVAGPVEQRLALEQVASGGQPAELGVLATGGSTVHQAGDLAVDAILFNRGGTLTVADGAITVLGAGGLSSGDSLGGSILVDGGSFIFNGHHSRRPLDMHVDGGVAANTGAAYGALDLHVSGGEAVLATSKNLFRLNPGASLTIEGSAAKVGFDGVGATGMFHVAGGELRFIFDEDGVSPIGAISSAWDGDGRAGVAVSARFFSGDIVIDLNDFDSANLAGRHLLVDAVSMNRDLGGMTVEILGLPQGYAAALEVDAARNDLYLDVTLL